MIRQLIKQIIVTTVTATSAVAIGSVAFAAAASAAPALSSTGYHSAEATTSNAYSSAPKIAAQKRGDTFLKIGTASIAAGGVFLVAGMALYSVVKMSQRTGNLSTQ